MIVSIDLGTTNSLVGVYQDGQVKLIPNAFGEYLTPSVVPLGLISCLLFISIFSIVDGFHVHHGLRVAVSISWLSSCFGYRK
jgi:chaperone hscC